MNDCFRESTPGLRAGTTIPAGDRGRGLPAARCPIGVSSFRSVARRFVLALCATTAGLCARVEAVPENPPETYQHPGVVNKTPVFADALRARLTFPLSWTSGAFSDFGQWREQARAKVRSCFLAPPPTAPWQAVVLAEEDRGTYVARKMVFNLTGDSRVLALMTVPKGKGPFPAVLLLHDHGARFDIGKEKVIRPFAGDPKLASAEAWSKIGYGGRFVGDELAQRGYVCFAIDALNWSDRGGGGYDAQASIASNLMHLGMSFAGLIAWEDLRSADFLAERPEVDARRIAAIGWSLGGFRAWQLAAMSDHIMAGAAICWMTEIQSVMSPGNNQTQSISAFTMLHPGLFAQLDYPDIASIACPKPMLFFNGRKDKLFPVDGVERAYAKMGAVWTSQGAADRLTTRFWDVGHTFNADMQDAVFAWLDGVMADRRPAPAAVPHHRSSPPGS
jgi:dienelactone hydrolase